ncbi:MAG: cation transporter [Eubacteriales bacterium]|nr:cation transporter [Eubacteriales bacterium]
MVSAVCIIFVFLITFFGVKVYAKKLSTGCCSTANVEKVSRIPVKDRNKSHYPYLVELKIDGMVCGNCAQKVENALNAQNGVWATVDLGQKKATVRMKECLDDRQLRDTIHQSGTYTVLEVIR